ncbi:unnamed protein product [Chrysoparadoxa australica]
MRLGFLVPTFLVGADAFCSQPLAMQAEGRLGAPQHLPESRRAWAQRLTGGVAVAVLARPGAAARAEEAQASPDSQLSLYKAEDGTYSFMFPKDFVSYRKPLKTHLQEVNYKSQTSKGLEIGVAVDPVRIESLEKFGTPNEVGQKVIAVERSKDGTIEAQLNGSSQEKQGDIMLYTIDYSVENVHYVSHFLAKVAIVRGKLYSCTTKVRVSRVS